MFPFGTTEVSYIASDPVKGDAAECSFTVTVKDLRVPTISCPGTVYKPLASPWLSAVRVTFPEATAADPFNLGVVVTQTEGLPSNSYFGRGSTTITYVAINTLQLTDTCSFEVVVTEKVISSVKTFCASFTRDD